MFQTKLVGRFWHQMEINRNFWVSFILCDVEQLSVDSTWLVGFFSSIYKESFTLHYNEAEAWCKVNLSILQEQ